MNARRLVSVSLLFALAPRAAFAHGETGVAFSFSSGFLHPLGGLDHVLAMVAVGLLAAQLGGRALWLVPGTFVAAMLAAALAGLAGLPLPGAEFGILLSVMAISLPVALSLGMPTALAMALVGLFAVFHGHAHGAELPHGADASPYVAGFALATALLHAVGVAMGLALGRLALAKSTLQLMGAGIVVAGCVMSA
jgi:urease accessory protein